jgi:hypothetical protein
VVVSQVPVAQSELAAQVAQSAAVPVGALQSHWWLVRLQVPPGQSALVVQVLAHLPEVGSQSLELQPALALHVEQAGEGGAVQPQVPRLPFMLQAKPPQSLGLRQPAVQTPVPTSQLPVAQSALRVHAPQRGAAPRAAQLQPAMPPFSTSHA